MRTRSSLTIVLLGAVCASSLGCVASVEGDDGDAADGKADGASAECARRHVAWTLQTFKPALEEAPLDPPRVAELEALARQAPCRGEIVAPSAWTTWFDLTGVHVFAPYFQQHSAAAIALLQPGSAAYHDQATFAAATRPGPGVRAAWQVMRAAAPIVVADHLAMTEWLGRYQVHAEQVYAPLRAAAGDEVVEPTWALQAGEAEFLDLLAQSRPRQGEDGAYAAWVELLGRVLASGFLVDEGDDFAPLAGADGCRSDQAAPCGRAAALARLVALAPAARGVRDSAAWMQVMALWAMTSPPEGDQAEPSYRDQLRWVDQSRPTNLTGVDAYRVWLEAIGDTHHAGILAGSVLPAQPCVHADDADEAAAAHAAFEAAHSALAADLRSASAPRACR